MKKILGVLIMLCGLAGAQTMSIVPKTDGDASIGDGTNAWGWVYAKYGMFINGVPVGSGGGATYPLYTGNNTTGLITSAGSSTNKFLAENGQFLTVVSGGGAQTNQVNVSYATNAGHAVTADGITGITLGSAATNMTGNFATAAQGLLANTALQPGSIPLYTGNNTTGLITSAGSSTNKFLAENGQFLTVVSGSSQSNQVNVSYATNAGHAVSADGITGITLGTAATNMTGDFSPVSNVQITSNLSVAITAMQGATNRLDGQTGAFYLNGHNQTNLLSYIVTNNAPSATLGSLDIGNGLSVGYNYVFGGPVTPGLAVGTGSSAGYECAAIGAYVILTGQASFGAGSAINSGSTLSFIWNGTGGDYQGHGDSTFNANSPNGFFFDGGTMYGDGTGLTITNTQVGGLGTAATNMTGNFASAAVGSTLQGSNAIMNAQVMSLQTSNANIFAAMSGVSGTQAVQTTTITNVSLAVTAMQARTSTWEVASSVASIISLSNQVSGISGTNANLASAQTGLSNYVYSVTYIVTNGSSATLTGLLMHGTDIEEKVSFLYNTVTNDPYQDFIQMMTNMFQWGMTGAVGSVSITNNFQGPCFTSSPTMFNLQTNWQGLGSSSTWSFIQIGTNAFAMGGNAVTGSPLGVVCGTNLQILGSNTISGALKVNNSGIVTGQFTIGQSVLSNNVVMFPNINVTGACTLVVGGTNIGNILSQKLGTITNLICVTNGAAPVGINTNMGFTLMGGTNILI